MDAKHRFDEEMRGLQVAAGDFAKLHPQTAKALSIDDVAHRDPRVERLFQNFAFLASRTKTALEEADGTIVEDIADRLVHGLQTPLPSVCVVGFLPGAETCGITETVLRGAEVRAFVAGRAGPVRMALSRNCAIHHLATQSARMSKGDDGKGRLEFRLASVAPTATGRWPRELDLFLGGSAETAWCMRHLLLRRLESAQVVGQPDKHLLFVPHPDPPGLAMACSPEARPLLDLRDFLCAQDAFRFVRLIGLERSVSEDSSFAQVEVVFSQAPPDSIADEIDLRSIVPNCTPVVNSTLEPIAPQPLAAASADIPLLAGDDPAREILDVESLRGASRGDPSRNRDYSPVRSIPYPSRLRPDRGTFRLVRRPNRAGGARTSASIEFHEPALAFPDEIVSGSAWCCDGNVPHESVRPKALREAGSGIPAGLRFEGVLPPTRILRPPDDPAFFWKILAHRRSTLDELLEADALKDLLRLFLWDPAHPSRFLIEGLRGIEAKHERVLNDGVCRPALSIRILWTPRDPDPVPLDLLGRLDVFADLLGRLFRARAPRDLSVRVALHVPSADIVMESGK